MLELNLLNLIPRGIQSPKIMVFSVEHTTSTYYLFPGTILGFTGTFKVRVVTNLKQDLN